MKISGFGPRELCEFAKSLGYIEAAEPLEDLFVLDSPKEKYRQLVFPNSKMDSSFEEMAWIAIEKIAKSQGITPSKILLAISENKDDVFSLRYFSDEEEIDSLPLEEAIEVLQATKKLILSSACSVVNPVLFHSKLSRKPVDDFWSGMRLRHTQIGSFTLRVSNPVFRPTGLQVFNSTLSFDPYFGRKAFRLLQESAMEVVENLENNEPDRLFKRYKNMTNPQISFNFLDALVE